MYKLPEDLESKYKFVTLASKRAEQLQMGSLPRVETRTPRKATVVAQEEVAKGIVTIYEPAVDAELEPTLDEEE